MNVKSRLHYISGGGGGSSNSSINSSSSSNSSINNNNSSIINKSSSSSYITTTSASLNNSSNSLIIDNDNENNSNSSIECICYGEYLFWKVWKNRYLLNLILNNICGQELLYTSMESYYLGNRIKFENILDLTWLVSKNQYTLLKDKLVSNQPLDISSKGLKLLYEQVDHPLQTEILNLLYQNKKNQISDIKHIDLSKVPIKGLKEYFRLNPSAKDILNNKSIVDNAISNMDFEILNFIKYIYQQNNNNYCNNRINNKINCHINNNNSNNIIEILDSDNEDYEFGNNDNGYEFDDDNNSEDSYITDENDQNSIDSDDFDNGFINNNNNNITNNRKIKSPLSSSSSSISSSSSSSPLSTSVNSNLSTFNLLRNSYNENQLIENACKSNDPERMFKFIEDELKLDLKKLIDKYPQNYYNMFMNILDKLTPERIKLIFHCANDGCTYEKPFHYIFPFKYTVDSLKCLILDTVPLKKTLISKELSIEELLECYKAGYEHKYFPFFIDYFFKQNQIEKVISYLKVSKTISTINYHYKNLYSDMQVFFYVETVRNFNIRALDYIIETKVSLNFLNKDSVIEPLTPVASSDQVVEFLKKFIVHFDVYCYIIKLLLIFYPIETIKTLIKIQEFETKFIKELHEKNEIIQTLLPIVSNEPEKIQILLKYRVKRINSINLGNSSNNGNSTNSASSFQPQQQQIQMLLDKSNKEKLQFFNNCCLYDINSIITNECKKELLQNLKLKNENIQDSIEIYNLIDYNSVIIEREIIQSLLFTEHIKQFYLKQELVSIKNLIITLLHNNNNTTLINKQKLSEFKKLNNDYNLNNNDNNRKVYNNNNRTNNISIYYNNSININNKFNNNNSINNLIIDNILLLGNRYLVEKLTKELIETDALSNEILIKLIEDIIRSKDKLPFSIILLLLKFNKYLVLEYLFETQKDHVMNSLNRTSKSKFLMEPNEGVDQLFSNFKEINIIKPIQYMSPNNYDHCKSLFLTYGYPNYLLEYLSKQLSTASSTASTTSASTELVLTKQLKDSIFKYTTLDQFLEFSKYYSFKEVNDSNDNNNNNNNNNNQQQNINNQQQIEMQIQQINNEIDNTNLMMDDDNINNILHNNNIQLNNEEGEDQDNEININNNSQINSNNNNQEESNEVIILNNSISFNRIDIICWLLENKKLSITFIMVSLFNLDKYHILDYLIRKFKNKYFSNPTEKRLNLVFLSLVNSNSLSIFKMIEEIYPSHKFNIGRSIVNSLVLNERNNEKLKYLHKKNYLVNLEYLNHKLKKVGGKTSKLTFPDSITRTINEIISQNKKRPNNDNSNNHNHNHKNPINNISQNNNTNNNNNISTTINNTNNYNIDKKRLNKKYKRF